jgi:hypothetical protein
MKPVKSSTISAIGHDPVSRTLHVEFHRGAKWTYADVGADEHAALVGAASIGSHFGKHIKPHKNAAKIGG